MAVVATVSVVLGATEAEAVAATEAGEVPATETDRWAAVADTYVAREAPYAVRGTAAKITAARWRDWHSTAYLRIRVGELRTDRPVRSAKLVFTLLRGAPERTELHRVGSDSWSETTTAYANRPAIGDLVATASGSAGASTLAFDVTAQLRAATGSAGRAYSYAVVNRTADSAFVAASREQGATGPRLVIEYGDPQPPGAPAMACGAAFKPESDGETYQEALAREDELLGGLDIARVYYRGAPAQWPGRLDTSGRPMIVSFKLDPADVLAGRYDAHLRDWFDGAPTDRDTYWVYFHEPEDNIERGAYTAADYRAAWRHIAALADRAGNDRLRATLVLMGYSLEAPSGRDWRDYYPGREVIDVLAWDIYNYVNEGDGGYRSPETLFGRAVAVTRTEGLELGVAETGSAIAEGDSGAGRAAWVRDTLTYLRDAGAVFTSYFDMYVDHNHGPQHYELRDAASQAAYREVCD